MLNLNNAANQYNNVEIQNSMCIRVKSVNKDHPLCNFASLMM